MTVMKVYRVNIHGRNLQGLFDGEELVCGFYKNEYVWANNEQKAAEIALERVKKKMAKNQAIHPLGDSTPIFDVELVESYMNPLNLFQNEGFIFYKVGSHPTK